MGRRVKLGESGGSAISTGKWCEEQCWVLVVFVVLTFAITDYGKTGVVFRVQYHGGLSRAFEIEVDTSVTRVDECLKPVASGS